jgi:hypothetical protein
MVNSDTTATALESPAGSRMWQQELAGRWEELSSLRAALSADDDVPRDMQHWDQAAIDHLKEAAAAISRVSLRSRLSGAAIQRATHNLDMAEINIYRMAPIKYLNSILPVLIDDAADILPTNDSRLRRLVELRANRGADNPPASGRALRRLFGPRPRRADGITEDDRDAVVAAAYAAKKASLATQGRVRSFRSVVLFAICLGTTVAITVAVAGAVEPEMFALCQVTDPVLPPLCPTGNVAPSAGDVPLV